MCKAKGIAGLLFALAMVFGLMLGMSVTVMAENAYLTFTGTESFRIKTDNESKNWSGTLEYSTNATTWTEWNGAEIASSADNHLYLRGSGNTKITGGTSEKWVITSAGEVSCEGDIRTLLDYEHPDSTIMGPDCFKDMFYGCTSLVEAPELPAETLTESCYEAMFSGCTSLVEAPKLPAKTLADNCYFFMFYGCTSLVEAPALPATTLAYQCYNNMFSGCTSLVNAPALPATTLALDCYGHMFENCTSLVNAPDLPATTLAESCYNNMFINCTSLVIAPDLPATTVGISCYTFMFQGCTGLLIPAELPAETLIHNCYQAMFKGCTSMKFSENKDESYNAGYRVPKSGNGTIADSSNALDEMFTGTNGAAFTPAINTTYYRVGYSVNITGGKNATASGGSTKQTALSREMTTVTFTPDSGYHFAEFDDITKDNVTVHRVSNVEVRVSGIPTAYVEIAVPDAAEGAPGKVPFTDPGQRYASSEDNFAPIASSGSIKSLVLDFSKVAGSEVKPSELRMTGIKGSVFTTKDKLRDKKSFKTTGGVKVRVNKDMTAKIICRKSGTATLTMADGNTYTITFKVQKPKAQKNAKIIPKGGSIVIKTVRDLFGTDIDAGELTIHKQKHSQATISDNKLYVDPKEEDKIKVRYKYLDKKYKITVKVK